MEMGMASIRKKKLQSRPAALDGFWNGILAPAFLTVIRPQPTDPDPTAAFLLRSARLTE